MSLTWRRDDGTRYCVVRYYTVCDRYAVRGRYTTVTEVCEACKSVSAVRLISGPDYRLISKGKRAHQKEGHSREFGGPKANGDRGGLMTAAAAAAGY